MFGMVFIALLTLRGKNNWLLCPTMMNRLFAISLAFVVIFSSIGLRVMHHHCIWCGNHPVEVIVEAAGACHSESCCTPPEEPADNSCRHDACCVETLMKIENGILSAENVHLKKPVVDIRALDFMPVIHLAIPASVTRLSQKAIPPPLLPGRASPVSLFQSWLC
jgi:hypothetical protein